MDRPKTCNGYLSLESICNNNKSIFLIPIKILDTGFKVLALHVKKWSK